MKPHCKFIFTFLCLLFITKQGTFAATIVDRIRARVDDQIITQSDVQQAKNQGPSQKFPSDTEALDHLVNDKIFSLELDREKILVTEKDIDRAIEAMLVNRQMSLEALKEELARRDLPFEEYRQQLAENLKRNQFLQQLIYPRIRITDIDLQHYYQKHIHQFTGYNHLRFLELLFTPESVPAGQPMNDFVTQIHAQLKKGASFQEMARRYSKGAFADKAGDSGLLETKSMRSDLVALLLSQQLNVVSDPIPLANNTILIFKVVEKKDPKPLPFQEVKSLVQEKYLAEKVEGELEQYLMTARSRHFIELK